VLSVLAGLAMLVAVFVALLFLAAASNPDVIQTMLDNGVPQYLINSLTTVMAVLAIIAVVYMVIFFLIAYGFWFGTRWAWGLGIAFAIVEIVSVVLQFVVAPSVTSIFTSAIGILIPLVILFYLNEPGTRTYFLGTQRPRFPLMR